LRGAAFAARQAQSGWAGERIMTIRDFRHARYALADAEVIAMD
jgi:hypothetical protein